MRNRGILGPVKSLPNLSRFRAEVSTSFLVMVSIMNGAFEAILRRAGQLRIGSFNGLLGGLAIPAMAAVGVVAIVAVLFGLQCGGLDKCFTVRAPVTAASLAPQAQAPGVPVAPAVDVAAAAAPVAAEPEIAPVTQVAMRQPAVSDAVREAQRADDMIGDTFAVLAVDDAGWLAGASAAAGDSPTEEGDGAGPPPPVADQAAVDAAEAAAMDAVPEEPLQRPEPLEVAAFVEETAETAAPVKAEAQQKLAEVASPDVAEEAAAEPEPEPVVAEPEPQPEPAAAPEPAPKPEPKPVRQASTGNTRTIAGAGVNVRSGPGKSNGKLFALAGGEKVKVGEDQRGWLKITDDQGRTGWVYKSYLN